MTASPTFTDTPSLFEWDDDKIDIPEPSFTSILDNKDDEDPCQVQEYEFRQATR